MDDMCSNWSPIYKSHLQERGFNQIKRTHRIAKDTPGMVGADGWRRRLAGTSQSGPDPWRGNTWLRHLDQENLVVVRQETQLCEPQPVREPGPFGNLSTLQQLESWRKLDPGFKSSQWSLADKHFEKYVWSNNCRGITAKIVRLSTRNYELLWQPL